MKYAANLRRVGENIRNARIKRGLRQTDVTVKIGLSYRHYQSIEAGKVNVTIDTLCRLARLYKVKPESLLRGVCRR